MSVEFATHLLRVRRIRLQLTKNLRTALKTIFKIDYSRISSAEPECIRTEVKKSIVTKCGLHHALLRGVTKSKRLLKDFYAWVKQIQLSFNHNSNN